MPKPKQIKQKNKWIKNWLLQISIKYGIMCLSESGERNAGNERIYRIFSKAKR